MADIEVGHLFPPPAAHPEAIEVGVEERRVRMGLRLWLIAMCVHLVNGVAMQILFWLSLRNATGVARRLLVVSLLIVLLIGLVEICAAIFFLSVPRSTHARLLAKAVPCFHIFMPLTNWLLPLAMIRIVPVPDF